MPEMIPLNDSTITESVSQGGVVRPSHDPNADPLDSIQEAGNRLRLEALDALKGLPEPVETFTDVQKKLSELGQAARKGMAEMERARTDSFIPDGARQPLWTKAWQETKAKIGDLSADSEALITITAAELKTKAMPKLDPERETAVRQEVSIILSDSKDPAGEMLKLLQSPDRNRAAVVLGGLGEAYLRRQFPDERERRRMREAFENAAIGGAEQHGSETEKSYARALKALPKIQGYRDAEVHYAKSKFAAVEQGRPYAG